MYRIAVCDDNILLTEKLCEEIRGWSIKEFINVEVHGFYGGGELLDDIKEYGGYHIILLDVELGTTNGLFIADEIDRLQVQPLILFMSAYDNYYKQAYKVHPFYFFSKPIHLKELHSIMKSAVNRIEMNNRKFWFWYKKVHYGILIKDILYFFSDRRRICIICKDENVYWLYNKLDIVEEIMQKKENLFLRIHKSYYINLQHVIRFYYDFVEMSNFEKLPISTKKRKNVRKMQILLDGES